MGGSSPTRPCTPRSVPTCAPGRRGIRSSIRPASRPWRRRRSPTCRRPGATNVRSPRWSRSGSSPSTRWWTRVTPIPPCSTRWRRAMAGSSRPTEASGTSARLRLEEMAGQLDAALREIVALLNDYHPPVAVRLWWERSCRATIAAIVRQRALGRGGHPTPGYAAALPLLIDSIGVQPYLAVGAIVGREPGLVSRLAATMALAGECALAIRLANDLCTWGKDESEGGFNTLIAPSGGSGVRRTHGHGHGRARPGPRRARGAAREQQGALPRAPGGRKVPG